MNRYGTPTWILLGMLAGGIPIADGDPPEGEEQAPLEIEARFLTAQEVAEAQGLAEPPDRGGVLVTGRAAFPPRWRVYINLVSPGGQRLPRGYTFVGEDGGIFYPLPEKLGPGEWTLEAYTWETAERMELARRDDAILVEVKFPVGDPEEAARVREAQTEEMRAAWRHLEGMLAAIEASVFASEDPTEWSSHAAEVAEIKRLFDAFTARLHAGMTGERVDFFHRETLRVNATYQRIKRISELVAAAQEAEGGAPLPFDPVVAVRGEIRQAHADVRLMQQSTGDRIPADDTTLERDLRFAEGLGERLRASIGTALESWERAKWDERSLAWLMEVFALVERGTKYSQGDLFEEGITDLPERFERLGTAYIELWAAAHVMLYLDRGLTREDAEQIVAALEMLEAFPAAANFEGAQAKVEAIQGDLRAFLDERRARAIETFGDHLEAVHALRESVLAKFREVRAMPDPGEGKRAWEAWLPDWEQRYRDLHAEVMGWRDLPMRAHAPRLWRRGLQLVGQAWDVRNYGHVWFSGEHKEMPNAPPEDVRRVVEESIARLEGYMTETSRVVREGIDAIPGPEEEVSPPSEEGNGPELE